MAPGPALPTREVRDRVTNTGPYILGVDPGSILCGVVYMRNGLVEDCHLIRQKSRAPLHVRLARLAFDLAALVAAHDKADLIAIERPYLSRRRGIGGGACMSDGAIHAAWGVCVATTVGAMPDAGYLELAPASIKKAMTGNGCATKSEVQDAVARKFNFSNRPPEDVADAAAIAYCAHLVQTEGIRSHS